MKKFSVLIILAFGLIFAGCPPRKAVQPEEGMVSPEERERGPEVRPGERITEEELAKVKAKEVEIPKYIEERGVFEDIHFDFDKYDIRADAKPTLKTVADWMLKNTAAKILIEGHCCELGTNEYNLALGDRRAKATRDYLVALGVASGRIEMVSYGEEKPLCSDKTEDCWQKNRRSHFVILREK
jgi:peptidoglycan-associated lipoprotein